MSWSLDELDAKIREISAILAEVPADEWDARYHAEIDRLPLDAKAVVSSVVVLRAMVNSSKQSMKSENFWVKNWEKLATFCTAIGFLLLLLVIAVFIPDPKPFQQLIFRVVLMIFAGAFAAFIPGFLNIESKAAAFSLRAGGALALSIVVYLVNPPALVKQINDDKAGHVTAPSAEIGQPSH
jgi:hypothetical protein